jgi:hypothetical protein
MWRTGTRRDSLPPHLTFPRHRAKGLFVILEAVVNLTQFDYRDVPAAGPSSSSCSPSSPSSPPSAWSSRPAEGRQRTALP